MFRFVLVFYFVVTLTPKLASAMTDEQKAQLEEHLDSFGKMCMKDNILSAEDIVSLQEKKDPTGSNSGCFLACMLREIGLMDDAGMLQKELTLEFAKSVLTDPEFKLAEDFVHSCLHVNDKDVSDGAMGCERALFAYSCMRDNASQFGFYI